MITKPKVFSYLLKEKQCLKRPLGLGLFNIQQFRYPHKCRKSHGHKHKHIHTNKHREKLLADPFRTTWALLRVTRAHPNQESLRQSARQPAIVLLGWPLSSGEWNHFPLDATWLWLSKPRKPLINIKIGGTWVFIRPKMEA